MDDNFKVEIISPEKIILFGDTEMVIFPSYEGDMGILKNHNPIITFLRPGIIKVKKNDDNFENFFVEDGTIEFFQNTLVILSSTAINLKDLSKTFIENLSNQAKEKLTQKDITDHQRYIINHKIDTLREIKI